MLQHVVYIIYIRVAPLEESTMKRIEPTHQEIMQLLDCCSAYGKYVLVTVGGELKDYKDFTEAAEAQGWKYERN